MLVIILFLALFVRVYRIDQLLGFYYDQGRDAKVIWDLWHSGKFFLIGPTTGIEGIFRGPWYYWLIAPAYLLGRGNPVWPTVFLAILSATAVWWTYRLATQIGGRQAGLICLIISSFSFSLITDARWLSNPTPMLIISMGFVQSLLWVVKDNKWGWIGLGLAYGMAMQFGSAAEIFYLPVIIYLGFIKRKKLPLSWLAVSIIAAGIAFLPQIIFDIRHTGILHDAIFRFLVTDGSFRSTFWKILQIRIPFYLGVFLPKLYPVKGVWWMIGLVTAVAGFIFSEKLQKIELALLILFISPLLGMLFFQGNHGNIYGYYFTGYYLIFVLLISIGWSKISKYLWGKLAVCTLLVVFLFQNISAITAYLRTDTSISSSITLNNQITAIDWIDSNSNKKDFNVDVYVPPVSPNAYDYLFLWVGTNKYYHQPSTKIEPLLYTLYEIDPPHPDRLETWLKRQRGIGEIEKRGIFGGITVDRERRIKSE